jgi:hypothetical protein
MASKNFTRFAVLFVILAALPLTNCGSINPINPPAVHAQAAPPAGCDGNGACSGNITHAWGYCDYSVYQTAKTFTVALEIGITSTPKDPNDSLCLMPFASGGGLIKSIHGNTNYTPWTNNLSSMLLDIRACTADACAYPGQQEHLGAAKYTVKGVPQSLPLDGVFPDPVNATAVMVVFNDDLDAAKPTTISVAFSGTFK